MLWLLLLGSAAPEADRVRTLPGFSDAHFPTFYSGYLHVPGPVAGYDELSIHYQLYMAETSAAPVVAWHQGGPGGSSVQGSFIEMGQFLVGDELKVNPYAWNRAAHMLYLESPAGSGQDTGFSECRKQGAPVPCSWDDVTQAEAYGHTLLSFYEAFPELKSRRFFLAGESYFGQYGPNIAHALTTEPKFASIPLKGLLVGNGCWGGSEDSVQCNGPHEEQLTMDALFGRALVSPKAYKEVYAACGFDGADGADGAEASAGCKAALDEAHAQVGPFNLYDVYDNCPSTSQFLEYAGKDMRWLLQKLRTAHGHPGKAQAVHAELTSLGGGYDWNCGGTYPPGKIAAYFKRKDVQDALHLAAPGRSAFAYNTSGPASRLLYPTLAQKLDILIYNGDADLCVPYNGNEEWISDLEAAGVLEETAPWRPWFEQQGDPTPAGAVTGYKAKGSDKTLQFLTIRLAGHMVPLFRPKAALAFFERFIGQNELAYV